MTDIRSDAKGATVGDLIDALSQYPMGMLLICASDAEENSYSPLAGLSPGWYEPESTWAGDVWYELDPEDVDQYQPCLVLGPIN